MKESVAQIFNPKPERWGMRGDPCLWDALEEYFSSIPLPCSPVDFMQEYHRTFHALTASGIETEEYIYLKNFDQGGISGGQIHKEFWHDTALPLLLKRLKERNEKSL